MPRYETRVEALDGEEWVVAGVYEHVSTAISDMPFVYKKWKGMKKFKLARVYDTEHKNKIVFEERWDVRNCDYEVDG